MLNFYSESGRELRFKIYLDWAKFTICLKYGKKIQQYRVVPVERLMLLLLTITDQQLIM